MCLGDLVATGGGEAPAPPPFEPPVDASRPQLQVLGDPPGHERVLSAFSGAVVVETTAAPEVSVLGATQERTSLPVTGSRTATTVAVAATLLASGGLMIAGAGRRPTAG